MNKFKKIMAGCHTQKKECLHKIYTDKQVYFSSVSSSEQPIEDEKIFDYRTVSFSFVGTGFRTPERVVLFVWVPAGCFTTGKEITKDNVVSYEDWLLRVLSEPVNELRETLQNNHKDSREKARFYMQTTSPVVQRRSGCIYVEEKEAFRLRIEFQFPLINGRVVNGKSSYKSIKLLLDMICDCLENVETTNLLEHIRLYKRQKEIQNFLEKNELLAFVADGSILPRQGDTELPMREAIPFQSPPELCTTVHFCDGSEMTGMGIKRGITIITGSGYSGKSTLLDALEQGIYFHAEGDGREYVIMEKTACKVYAEDGRYVYATDISPFFSYVPGDGNICEFSTPRASGSVSQAVNIVEAVYGGSRCLLIEEDTSATNFMIQDSLMRQFIRNESIIPYTDRIQELKEKGISTILVIGGSSEYLKYGDRILLLEDYRVFDKTLRAKEILSAKEEKAAQGKGSANKNTHQWMGRRRLPLELSCNEFFTAKCVQIDNARYIKIDDVTVDVTYLTALVNEEQINSLVWLLEKLLQKTEESGEDLKTRCDDLIEGFFDASKDTVLSADAHQYEFWLEEVRSLDLVMAAVRMRKGSQKG